jgi:hypothetical protein
MKKQELKKIILEEVKYVQNLLKEKKDIENRLNNFNDDDFENFFDTYDDAFNGLNHGHTDKLGGTSSKDFWTDNRKEKEFNNMTNDEIEEITGKGQAVNRRSSHKGEIGRSLKKEEDVNEMNGIGSAPSKCVSKNTTNPVYKRREEKGYIQESDLEKMVKNILTKKYL